MKKYQVVPRKGLFGIKNKKSKELIIACENQSAEILCERYFYLSKEGKKIVVNENNSVIFDFANQPDKNEFTTNLGTYNLLCIEEQGEILSFFGENSNPKVSEEIQIQQVIIMGDQVSKKLMKKREYLDTMLKEIGFDVDRSKLKNLLT